MLQNVRVRACVRVPLRTCVRVRAHRDQYAGNAADKRERAAEVIRRQRDNQACAPNPT